MGRPLLAAALCLGLMVAGAARAQQPQQAQADANPAPATQPAFELKDGDRVVFVGGTFMEREAQLGYIETMLTTRFPDRNVTFRNLGYAGDTVACEARRICRGWATFGGPDEGFNRLQALIQEIKPTVVIAAYGMGESFGGEAKLPEFVQKYERLLDMVTTAGGLPKEQVRVVLLSPTGHEEARAVSKERADQHKVELKRYSDAIRAIADGRGYRFVDLFTFSSSPTKRPPLTDNGIHLNQFGAWAVADEVARALNLQSQWSLTVDAAGKQVAADGAALVSGKTVNGALELQVRAPLPLPSPGALDDRPDRVGSLRVTGLPPGFYVLRAGEQHAWGGKSMEWEQTGGTVLDREAVAAAEKLRDTIVSKNFAYFNYWRPQNDTYILGYRKREQGRNAVEMPQFRDLAEQKDREVASLRAPAPRTYTLSPRGD